MVAVLSKTGIRLMPTTNYKARKLLKSRRAVIYQYRPFTIRLLDREDGNVQIVEFKEKLLSNRKHRNM
ncbi:RRXRR domain-containing protein [Butyrivibrio sp. INlla21]|uniref:RRXRR domain-containing protein n=1 Tax=Butyrivibrio sp. INlla21 TaxID=1520811 RepID=UPI0008ED6DFC|nr:RRXRR domain-containing protein [Butyrivibrio sp. INlla21]SFU57530.1 RRXRR protein [Butyrivibrio sp. INlla21]